MKLDPTLLQIIPPDAGLIDQIRAFIHAAMAMAWIDGKIGIGLMDILSPADQKKIRDEGLSRSERYAAVVLQDILTVILNTNLENIDE